MTLKTLEREVAGIRIAPKGNSTYSFLLKRYPPREITSKALHSSYIGLIEALMRLLAKEGASAVADGIRMYLELLVPLITRFEDEHYPKSRVPGRVMLAYLMEEHSLNQGDLVKEIGSQPYVSDILSGKKQLTAQQIGKLSKRFNISPSVFFDE